MIFQMKKSNVISDVLYKTVVFSNYFQSVMKVNRKKRNPKMYTQTYSVKNANKAL